MGNADYFYKIVFIAGEHHAYRGVAFLDSEDIMVTAKRSFDGFPKKIERRFRTLFDAWIDGKYNKKWFHGWDKSEFSGNYSDCFVFKNNERRLYGFLVNPKASDRRYQVCILVTHATKRKHETDPSNLEAVRQVKQLFKVKKIIEGYFQESLHENSLDRKKH